MSKITLNSVGDGSFLNASTAAATINANNGVIQAALDNTLSRDGTSPNTMVSNLDMNSNRIINLPAPLGATEPVRLTDLTAVNGSVTINAIPAGGTTGQGLLKTSNVDYAVNFGNIVSSVGLSLPADFTVTNSPVTGSGTLTGAWVTTPTGTGGVVRQTSPTLISPLLGTPTSGNLANTTGLPISTGVSGLAAGAATFLATPTSANLATLMTDETGTGANVFGTTPTITTPNIVGTVAVGNAAAGSVGEFIQSIVASGSAVAQTTNTGTNITSISLTAGDWDVWSMVYFTPAASTNIVQLLAGHSLTTGSLSLLGDRVGMITYASAGVVPGVSNCGIPMFQTRFNVSTTTTIFLVAQPNFTVSTLTAWGSISARRVR